MYCRLGFLGCITIAWAAAGAGIGGDLGQEAVRARTRPATEWKLPTKPTDNLVQLTASANARLICFTVMSSRRLGPAQEGPRFKAWMLDANTGKFTDLGDLIAKKLKQPGIGCHAAVPSPDGNHVVLMTRRTGPRLKMTAYLLTVEGDTVRKLIEGMPVLVAWSRDSLYVSCAGADGGFGPVRKYDPTTGEFVNLKVCGMVAAVEPAGKFLVCACDPEDPTKPLRREETRNARMLTITEEGEVLSTLAQANELSEAPVLSPNGMYLAFQRQVSRGRHGPPQMLGTRVVSADGKVQWETQSSVAPVAVTDSGGLIASVKNRSGPGAVIQLIDRAGQGALLAANASGAIVCGDRLFCIVRGVRPKLKVTPLKSSE